jgi:hypothetical protein
MEQVLERLEGFTVLALPSAAEDKKPPTPTSLDRWTAVLQRLRAMQAEGLSLQAMADCLSDAHPLTFGNFEALLARAKTILNRYSHLWATNTYEMQIIGRDDYQYVFKCVEEKLQRIDEEKQERRRARRSRRPSDSPSDGHGDGR